MKIGIIGTGALGGTIVRKLVAAGHEVKVTDASPLNELQKTAGGLGVVPASIQDVVKDVSVVFVSIPTRAIPELPKDLFTGIQDDVIVVDTSNYYPYRDGAMQEFSNGKLESVWVSEQLGRQVIKAFNNLLSFTLDHAGKAAGDKERIAMAISGDDAKAKSTIASLVNDIGFDIVDAGDLSESWRHQPGMPSYCTELNALELKAALADTDGVKKTSAELRDLTTSKLMESSKQPTHEEMLAVIRSLFPTNPKRYA